MNVLDNDIEKYLYAKLDNNKFKATNQLWNTLKCNSIYNIGCLCDLIKEKPFDNVSAWVDYYFESGNKRLEEINKLEDEGDREKLMSGIKVADKKLNKLLYSYGRTYNEIIAIAELLYNNTSGLNNTYSLDECISITFTRLFIETWNGIIEREKQTEKQILKNLKNKDIAITLIDTQGEFDNKYAVDFEVYYKGCIICGIQVKPNNYRLSNAPYLLTARAINTAKNNLYTQKFDREVLYVYSDTPKTKSNKNYEICNTEIYEQIEQLIIDKEIA